SAATTIGALLAFAAGRFFLKDTVRPMVVKNKYLNKWLFDNTGKNQLFVLVITRLVPVFPYNLQNFAYGITDIKFSTYMIGSLVFMLPGTAMYTVGTAGLADKENRMLYMGIAAILAIGVMGMGVFLKRRYIQEEQDGR
uniref:TVP38/TMEM64 family protein n=1 Tax=Lacrimispora sp. TaxID=2719234 RepID=UPI0028AA40BA